VNYSKDQRFTAANQLLENMLTSDSRVHELPELQQVKTRQDAILRAVIMKVDLKNAVNYYIDSIMELDNALKGLYNGYE